MSGRWRGTGVVAVLALVASAMAGMAAAPATATSSDLVYGGGPVETAPKLYLVFWGSEWSTLGDPSNEAASLKSFYGTVFMGADPWLQTTREYCQGVPPGSTSCPPGSQFVGAGTAGPFQNVWYDTSLSAPEGGDTTIGAEAANAAAHFGNTTTASNVNAQYVIATPTKRWAPGTGVLYCSSHSSMSSRYGTIVYTYLPYVTDWQATCGTGSVNSATTASRDAISMAAGAELADVLTDPMPETGWADLGGAEIANKCPGMVRYAAGFAVPALWSNAAHGCV